MTGEGKPPSAWLRKITEDQNLTQLSEIENVVYNTLRQLFLSAEIKPDVIMGGYDAESQKITLGRHNVVPLYRTAAAAYTEIQPDSTFAISTVSQQSTDFTVTDGQTWELVAMIAYNGSQVSRWNFLYTPDNFTTTYGIGANGYDENIGAASSQDKVDLRGTVVTGSGTDVKIRAYASAFAGGNTINVTLIYRRLA